MKIKLKALLLTILCSLFLSSFAQPEQGGFNKDSITKLLTQFIKDQTKKDSVKNKQIDSIKKIIDLYAKGDQLKEVGVIRLLNKPIAIHHSTMANFYSKVDSVKIFSNEGFILAIYVYIKDSVFVNTKAPIELSARRIAQKDRLRFSGDDKYYIEISDVLRYDHTNLFSPDNDEFVLTTANPSKKLYKAIGINDIFDIKIFSDVLGLIGGKSNGLVQTEANYKHIIHRSNFPNCNLFFFQYFNINLKASKFDSKFKSSDSSKYLRTDLLQRNWLSLDASLNLLNIYLPKRSPSHLYFDIGVGLNNSNIVKQKDTISTISKSWFHEVGYCVYRNDILGVNLRSRQIYNYSPSIDYNSGLTFFWNPNIEFFYTPKGNDVSKLFFKINYVSNMNLKNSDFMQIQVGYSAKLSSITF